MERLKRLIERLKKVSKKTWLRILFTAFTATGVSVPLLNDDVGAHLVSFLPVLTEPLLDNEKDTLWLTQPDIEAEPESVWRSSEHIPVDSNNGYSNRARKKKLRKGAVCKDGTWSTSRGQGACARHGGVAEWIYEEPEREKEKTTYKQPLYTPPPQHFMEGFNLMQFAILITVALVLIVMIKKTFNS